MDNMLDILWLKIVAGVQQGKSLFDLLLGPLNLLGPAIAIMVIATGTVMLTLFLTKNFKTRRYQKLREEFLHCFNLRQEALKCKDREKAKGLARNIDQARLNKVYYDYFFEGFLISIATKYLPILTVLAYVNEAYRPENLMILFGREYILKLGRDGADPILIGGVLWFVLSLFLVYLILFAAKGAFHRFMPRGKRVAPPLPSSSVS